MLAVIKTIFGVFDGLTGLIFCSKTFVPELFQKFYISVSQILQSRSSVYLLNV